MRSLCFMLAFGPPNITAATGLVAHVQGQRSEAVDGGQVLNPPKPVEPVFLGF